jgi:hypothetical protein
VTRREFINALSTIGMGIEGRLWPRPSRVDVIHTRVFAATPTGGNPCPVVPFADQLTAEEMLRMAQRFGPRHGLHREATP